MKDVLAAISNLRAMLSKASPDDKLVALNFLYWSDKGPVFEVHTPEEEARFLNIMKHGMVHTEYPNYTI